jgi:DTW domain-containing protein YfiP
MKVPYERKRKTKAPCLRCHLHLDHCICSRIPQLELKTRVVLVIHAKEMKRTSNTGTLATAALLNSELRIRGVFGQPLDLSDLAADQRYDALLLCDSPDSVELTAELVSSYSRPILLIVPDGNWRQANKVAIRHKELGSIPRVIITAQNTALKHLRAETKSYGMSTLQAIARAMGVIEGADVEKKLEDLYQAKLHHTLKARGVPL